MDATGGLTHKADDNSPFLLVAVVGYDTEVDKEDRIVSISNCLPASQKGYNIIRYLQKVQQDYLVVNGECWRPNSFTIDFSRPLINSIVIVFHKKDLAKYLDDKFSQPET